MLAADHTFLRMSLDALTPAMRDVLDRISRAGRPPMHTLSVHEARAAYALGAEILDLPRAPLPRVEDLRIAARDGTPLPARLYAPSTEPGLPLLLYLHGGGFTIGNLETHDSLCRQLAAHSGAVVVSLAYRLAPEQRFPVAVEDCWDGLAWLAGAGADALRLDGRRIAVGGDSAGGTLAAVMALMARDADLALRLQLLFYPGTTAHQDTESHRRYAQGLLLDKPMIDWFFGRYIFRSERRDWRFAPLEAPDHAGVAPAFIGLAECDPLVDEGIAYGDALRAAGVPVQLELWRGVVHDFIKMGRVIPEALDAHAKAGAALKDALFA